MYFSCKKGVYAREKALRECLISDSFISISCITDEGSALRNTSPQMVGDEQYVQNRENPPTAPNADAATPNNDAETERHVQCQTTARNSSQANTDMTVMNSPHQVTNSQRKKCQMKLMRHEEVQIHKTVQGIVLLMAPLELKE